MKLYGTKPEHFAKIAEKNHRHSVENPNSQFRDEYSLQQVFYESLGEKRYLTLTQIFAQIEDSPMVFEPLTKLQCCPTSDGGAAAVVASEDFVRHNKLEDRAVEIVGMEMATDFPSTFNEKSMIKMVGFDMTKYALALIANYH